MRLSGIVSRGPLVWPSPLEQPKDTFVRAPGWQWVGQREPGAL
jgi:hypothetical protein